MSNKKFINFILISAILFLHCSCKDKDESAIVGYQKNVMDSICKKNQNKIDQLCNKIVAIPEIKNGLNTELIIADNQTFALGEDTLEKAKKIFNQKEFGNQKTFFSEQNCLFVTKYSNITSHLGKQISTDSSYLNYKFNVRLVNEVNPDYSDLPKIWNCYQEKDLLNTLQSSLNTITKKELINNSNLFLNTVAIAKYYVFVEDQFCFIPQLIDNLTFNSGLVITSVKIFETATNQKVAQKTFYILNSESVNIVETTNPELQKLATRFDLIHNRNQKINDYLFFTGN